MPQNQIPRLYREASLVTLAVNFFLMLLKAAAGLFLSAPALLSDALHSGADLFTTLVVFLALCFSRKYPKRASIEPLACIFVSSLLFVCGLSIGLSGTKEILLRSYLTAPSPNLFALPIALFAILMKILLTFLNAKAAQLLSSPVLRADAFHQLTDILATLGALFGTAMANFGYPIFAPLASIFVGLFILFAAGSVFRSAVKYPKKQE